MESRIRHASPCVLSWPSHARCLARAAAVVLLAVCTAPPAVAQTSAPTRDQAEQRLLSVSRLIDGSSGARQVEASGSAQAQAARQRARELHRQAQQAFDAGDYATATRLLDEAARAMFEGVRNASPGDVVGAKERRDLESRLASTQSLLDAQRRIAGEKGVTARDAELVARIESLLAESRRLGAAGDVAAARAQADQAYLLAKASVGSMRSGDTLVRSVSFASKEEEYRYEVDRYDTHRMLVDLLARDRGRQGDPTLEAAVREAGRLRASADEQAARGDYAAGIRTLAESPRELVRAIRGMGVYIPG
jgi:hypothetical protein